MAVRPRHGKQRRRATRERVASVIVVRFTLAEAEGSATERQSRLLAVRPLSLAAKVGARSLSRSSKRARLPALPGASPAVAGQGAQGHQLASASVTTIECRAVLFDLDGVLVDSTALVTRLWTE